MSNDSLREDRRAGFTWFPADWLADEGVRAVSFAADGLWTGMLCLMARSPRRGMLLRPNGSAVSADYLAKQLGGSAAEIEVLLKELEDESVFSREEGHIICRKMWRKTELSETRAAAGRKGGLAKGKQNLSNGRIGREGKGKELVKLYGEVVKPPAHDTSRSQAKKNAANLLKTIAYADLEQAVKNYAESCDILDKGPRYRKNAGNFFGKEAVHEGFMPDVYERPEAPKPKGGARGKEGAPDRDIHTGEYKKGERLYP